jgi:transposase-like protein
MNQRRKHVHLGERLEAIDRIREGRAGVDQVAREMGVSSADVREWQHRHSSDRTVLLAEIRRPQSAEESRLAARVQLLARLVADADRELRALHEEYIRSLPASNELFEASNEAFDDELRPSKKFG